MVCKRIMSLLGICFLALMSGGCFCHPTKLTISIDMDKSLRDDLGDRPIKVDIVALTANQHAQFQAYSMTDYWAQSDSKWKDMNPKELLFDPKKDGPMVFSANDPAWNNWPVWEPHNV